MNPIYDWPWWALLIACLALAGITFAALLPLFDDGGMAGISAAVILLLAFLIPMAMRESREFQRWCTAHGGHTVDNTEVVSTVGANGKPAVGTATTTFCLTADGRILRIG